MTDRLRSVELNERLHALIPGGAHTYAKGDDQYPEGMAPVIARGLGSHVWDVDGNEYIEYGSGLRAVMLGHAHPAVVRAAREALALGTNFIRPSRVEVEAAEALLDLIDAARDGEVREERLGRARRPRYASPGPPPAATSSRSARISRSSRPTTGSSVRRRCRPGSRRHRDATVRFRYNDLDSVAALLRRAPRPDRLRRARGRDGGGAGAGIPRGLARPVRRARRAAGPRRDDHRVPLACPRRAARVRHPARPVDVRQGDRERASVSALVGRRDIMELGGIRDEHERVFLLSTTHGAETHAPRGGDRGHAHPSRRGDRRAACSPRRAAAGRSSAPR